MKQALIAGTFVIGSILLVLAVLLFFRPTDWPAAENRDNQTQKGKFNSTRSVSGNSELIEPEEIEHFVYLDSCEKYVMKDFMDTDIFEKNKQDLRQGALTTIREAGEKIANLLEDLENEGRSQRYILVLEGNLMNEWTDNFERNNTWAYRLSYERALVIYKEWLKEQIDLRRYRTELIITGGGYYGLCPTKDLKATRFSVQLIPKN